VTAALTAGLLGLSGTVIGAVLTTWTARQTAARSDHRTWVEVRRQEYRSAVTHFAGALLSYREAERDRWRARHDAGKDEATATQEAYRLRAAMLDAFYALQLSSSDNGRLRELAREAVEAAYRIREADTEPEMIRRAHNVRQAIDDMISAARIGEPGDPRDGGTRD
jgi:hypothetical protein